jgi:hypothetical protein
MTNAPLLRRSTACPALDFSIAPGLAEPAPTISYLTFVRRYA